MVADGVIPAPGASVTPPVKRKRGRPRKVDALAAAAAAAAAAGGAAPDGANGVPRVVPATVKPEPKVRKVRKRKGQPVPGMPIGVDASLVGKPVTGVLDGSFDAGYLLTVKVGDNEAILRGVVFGPGLTVPLSKSTDIAPGVKEVRRDETLQVPAPAPVVAVGAVGVPVVPAGATAEAAPATVPVIAVPAAAPAEPAAVILTPVVTDPSPQGAPQGDQGATTASAP